MIEYKKNLNVASLAFVGLRKRTIALIRLGGCVG